MVLCVFSCRGCGRNSPRSNKMAAIPAPFRSIPQTAVSFSRANQPSEHWTEEEAGAAEKQMLWREGRLSRLLPQDFDSRRVGLIESRV